VCRDRLAVAHESVKEIPAVARHAARRTPRCTISGQIEGWRNYACRKLCGCGAIRALSTQILKPVQSVEGPHPPMQQFGE
jgi:hypothetical protein